MAPAETIDFETLLAEISPESPTGTPLRSESGTAPSFYSVRDLRTQSVNAERALLDYESIPEDDRLPEDRPDPPQWAEVKSLCQSILTDESKHLWVAAWLVEALVREDGFAGLRDGYRYLVALCERFWGELHPRTESNQGEPFSQVVALNQILLAPLNQVVLFPATNVTPPLTVADCRDASTVEGKAEEKARRQSVGEPTFDVFFAAAAESGTAVCQELTLLLQDTLQALKQFDETVEQKFEEAEWEVDDAPTVTQLTGQLEEIQRWVKLIVKPVLGEVDAEIGEQPMDAIGAGERPTVESHAASAKVTRGVIQSREEAFQTLEQVARYFRSAEPHSPVSYALEQVVRWGRMPLPELVKELVRDKDVRRQIADRTGLPDEDSEQDD